MKRFNRFKTLLVFLALVVVTPGLILISSGEAPEKAKANKKVIKKGATVTKAKGHKRSWTDINKDSLKASKEPRRKRPVMNMKRNRPIVKKDTTPDPVVQRTGKKTADSQPLDPRGGGPLQMADPIIDFAGMSLSANGAGWPPDTVGDVGINHYVQAVNTSIGIYQKSNGNVVSTTTFDSFFGGPGIAGTPCDNDNNGDPVVLYDPYDNRWFILDFAWDPSETDGSWFSIAVSDTSDPTGTWTQFAMRADFVYLADYPKAGIWHDAIYISANMFSFPNGPFQGAKVWALNKADLYSGTLNAQSVSSTNYYAWSLLPSNAKGPTLPSATTPNYMITMDANEYGPPSTDKLVYWEYDVNWTTPGLTSFTGPTFLPTAAFGLTASGIPQPGTGWQLDSLFGRLMFPAIYREFDGHAAMYVNHVAESGGKRVERWYELRFSGGTPSIYQQGTYAPDSIHRWMGSIAADEDGNIAIGYTASSSALFPSVRYSAQASIAAVSGVLGLGEKSIKDGTGSQIGISRWGDYSAISIDPTDDETFWYTNEYYISSGSNWQTRIGAFKIKPDLWSQDRPDDVGDEPNTTSSHFWQSQDIWIRNQNDGFTVQVHQNPEYGQTNYFYVKIRNRDSEGSGIDKVYWAYPGTGLSWPASWNFIGQQPTGTLTQGSTTILEFPWSPPDPGAYATPHFCLLSRIETSPIPPYGMTFPEVSSINTNVRNNNNIVWKNITIVDNVPPGPSGGGGGTTIIAVNNLKKRAVTTRIEFVAVEQADTALTARRAGVMTTTASTKKNVLDWGKVEVDLGTTLFSRWNTKSRKGTGVTADAERATYIKIDEDKAHIEDIELKAGEEFLIRFNFLPFEDSADDKTEYVFDVIQYDFNGKEYEEIGGVRLVLRPPKEDTKTDAKK